MAFLAIDPNVSAGFLATGTHKYSMEVHPLGGEELLSVFDAVVPGV